MAKTRKKNPPSALAPKASGGNTELIVGALLIGGAAAAGVYYLYTRNKSGIRGLGTGLSNAVTTGTTALTGAVTTAADTVTAPIRQGAESLVNTITGSTPAPALPQPTQQPTTLPPQLVPVNIELPHPTQPSAPTYVESQDTRSAAERKADELVQRGRADDIGRVPFEIQNGLSEARIMKIKKLLLSPLLGYSGFYGNTSILDRGTRIALYRFQAAHAGVAARHPEWRQRTLPVIPMALTPDGVIGRETIAALTPYAESLAASYGDTSLIPW